jgi:ubiquinone/menaquinone biosynthesis C-methylase UbiE
MSDWRSYDQIAGRYDQVAAARFRVVALRMWALLPLTPDARILDIGTGTGVVPLAAVESGRTPTVAVGGDRAQEMLVRGRQCAPWLRVVVCDAVALPFRDEGVDIATASFVLSHLREPSRALREIRRVLKPQGATAVSSWAPASDPFSAAWSDALAEAITRPEAERASREVIPSEAQFSEAGRLESALGDAGLSVTISDTVDLTLTPTVEQFVDDRELTPGGRLGLSLLGPEEWARFKARFRTTLESRFGSPLRYSRQAFVVVAIKSPA